MNATPLHELSDDQIIEFLRELKSRLQYSSMRKVIAVLRLIFTGLRQGLNEQHNALIAAKTPRLLQLIFMSSCKHKRDQHAITHLDEFVDSLYESSIKNEQVIFKSEIDALRIISVVLISLEGLYNTAGVQLLNYTLIRELGEIVQEEEAFY